MKFWEKPELSSVDALKEQIYPPEKQEDDRTVHPFIFWVFRPVSWRPTLFLHRLRISATACTLISAVIFFAGAFVLAVAGSWFPAWAGWVLGAVLVNVYLFLDVIDGNLARLNREATKAGEFLDCGLNALAGAVLPAVLGIGLYAAEGDWLSRLFGVPLLWLFAAGFLIACLRLIRRVLTDHAIALAGDSDDRAKVLGESRRGPKYWAAIVNSAAFPAVIPVALIAAPSAWLAFYLAFNVAATAYSMAWAYGRVRSA